MDFSVCADCGPGFWEVLAPLLVGAVAVVLSLSIPKTRRGRFAAWLLFGAAVASFWLAVDRLYSPW